MNNINAILTSRLKIVMAILGIMVSGLIMDNCVYAQSSSDTDELVKIVVPPRLERGILYAPLNLDVLAPSETASEISPENIFPEATFIAEHEFGELKQGLEEISIPYRTVGLWRNGQQSWWIWRDYYISEYIDHAYFPKQGFETNLIGRWIGIVFKEGNTNCFSVLESGKFQLEAYSYTVSGSLKGYMEEGRIFATSECIILHTGSGMRLYHIDYRTNSMAMRQINTVGISFFRDEFTRDKSNHNEANNRFQAIGDKSPQPDP